MKFFMAFSAVWDLQSRTTDNQGIGFPFIYLTELQILFDPDSKFQADSYRLSKSNAVWDL